MSKRDYIVSSAHLADPGTEELSEFEFGLILAHNAFERWIVRCMTAAGYPDLSRVDILVLHSVHHRGRPKRLADLCFVLNIEDSHVVNYALRKLAQLDLVVTIDSAPAHLGGALGRPTWMLNRATSEWRWGWQQTESFWYPTMRLFNQAQLGAWAPVIAAVGTAMTALWNQPLRNV